jgi:hypothetical protein
MLCRLALVPAAVDVRLQRGTVSSSRASIGTSGNTLTVDQGSNNAVSQSVAGRLSLNSSPHFIPGRGRSHAPEDSLQVALRNELEKTPPIPGYRLPEGGFEFWEGTASLRLPPVQTCSLLGQHLA